MKTIIFSKGVNGKSAAGVVARLHVCSSAFAVVAHLRMPIAEDVFACLGIGVDVGSASTVGVVDRVGADFSVVTVARQMS